jgi:glutathionylspermidine synthase
MERKSIAPRQNWQKKVEELGLLFHTQERPYWDESAYYELTGREVSDLEKATNDLHALCLDAVQHVIDKNRFAELAIPQEAIPFIRQAWEEEPPSIYGRFDLAYDGKAPPKLLEYNADTPTALLEAGVIQWYWLEELFPKEDQFNSIHERLLAKWKDVRPYLKGTPLYFAHMDDTEDMITATYLRDTAQQSGIETAALLIEEIGWDSDRDCFVDLEEKPIHSIFKLYPWEWMIHEEFGVHVLSTRNEMQWIEPIWKMALSNKGILSILWELNPGHPNLLEAHFKGPEKMSEYVRKPLLSREGANITVTTAKGIVETGGDYGEEGYVYQAVAPQSNFSGFVPVIGSWVIDGQAAGVGIRESEGPVTSNLSRFVPHLFR